MSDKKSDPTTEKKSKSVIRSGRNANNNNKGKLDSKTSVEKGQLRLDTTKRVSFDNDVNGKGLKSSNCCEEEHKVFKELMAEELKKMRQEKVEIEKLKIDINAREVEIIERLERIEKEIEDWKENERERNDRWEELRRYREESDKDESRDGATSSVKSFASVVTGVSRISGLSEREVWKMKKIVMDKDRQDRSNNIVVKGVEISETDYKAWGKAFLLNKLGVDAEIENVRKSGSVIVIKLSNREKKIEIMKNKNKLSGTKIYIENDLTYEDRKKQEEISKWVKNKKEIGWNVKAGQGRILFKGLWRKWEEIIKVEEEMMRMDEESTARSVEPGFQQPRNGE